MDFNYQLKIVGKLFSLSHKEAKTYNDGSTPARVILGFARYLPDGDSELLKVKVPEELRLPESIKLASNVSVNVKVSSYDGKLFYTAVSF